MDAEEGVQLNIDILCANHFIVSTCQQVTQSTIQNCFVKCCHMKKNQEGSDVKEVDGSGEDDVTQDEDWVRLRANTAGMDFDAYVSVDQELATCGVVCMKEMCGVVWWEVEVEWRRGNVMVVMMAMKSSLTQC
jgi:hypothetical protein